jgi:FlaA1/EpsC-like NDP-sugar epimerase
MIKSIKIISLPRYAKISLILSTEILIAIIALYFAFAIRLDNLILNEYLNNFYISISFFPLLIIMSSKIFSTHLVVTRSINISNIYTFVIHSFFITLSFVLINFLLDVGIPRSVPVIFFLLFLILIILMRLIMYSIILRIYNLKSSYKKNVAIFGASNTGIQLSATLNSDNRINLVAFIDDDLNLINTRIINTKVYSRNIFKKKLESLKVDEIWIATPSATYDNNRDIISFCLSTNKKVLSLPNIDDFIIGGDLRNRLKEIIPEDFLGRDKVSIENSLFKDSFCRKNILITGAGGSIGSEITLELVNSKPKKIVLFELSELALYQILDKLKDAKLENVEIIDKLGSVNDSKTLKEIFQQHNIDIVIHAAAYKHVNLVERNVVEGFRNNVFGTYSLLSACAECEINRFILISTDKAVRPTNVMGTTKRISELIVKEFSENYKSINFAIVRFGNVLGSSGSVIPLFKKQILSGGPVTLTDPRMKRFFMAIPEAAKLILLAGSLGKNGEIFILDMGKPIKIEQLAINMIHLYGYSVKNHLNPSGDIEIKIINKQPGEKLDEELIINGTLDKTIHSKVLKVNEDFSENINIDTILVDIKELIAQEKIEDLKKIYIKYNL